jgi:hypothetical protein
MTYPQQAASTMAIQKASVNEVFKKISPFTKTCKTQMKQLKYKRMREYIGAL